MRDKSELNEEELHWLEVFQELRATGSFHGHIVSAIRIGDLNNQRKLKQAFPEVYEGYELWLSGEFSRYER